MSLTGGTRDVNPQYFNMTTLQSGNDVAIETSFPTPIDVMSGRNGGATIMEVLKAFVYLNDPSFVTGAKVSISVMTKSNGASEPGATDGGVLLKYFNEVILTTSGAMGTSYPIVFDLTDGAGHGVLVATQNLYLQVVTSATAVTNRGSVKLLYRFKRVGLTEYIGIVQSQQ